MDSKLRIYPFPKKRDQIFLPRHRCYPIFYLIWFHCLRIVVHSIAYAPSLLLTGRTVFFFSIFFSFTKNPNQSRWSCRLNAMNMINFGQIFIVLFFFWTKVNFFLYCFKLQRQRIKWTGLSPRNLLY